MRWQKPLENIDDYSKKIVVQKDYLKPKIDEDEIVRVGLKNFCLMMIFCAKREICVNT